MYKFIHFNPCLMSIIVKGKITYNDFNIVLSLHV